MIQVENNTIVIEIKDERERKPTDQKQPQKTEDTDTVATILQQGENIAGDIPIFGKYISQFTSIKNNVGGAMNSIGKVSSVGGGVALGVGAVVSALSLTHELASSFVRNRRQAEEIQRRAFGTRRQ